MMEKLALSLPVFTCSKLIKTPEQSHWRSLERHWLSSGVFIVNFEQISDIVLVFPLLPLNKLIPVGE